MRDQSCPSHEEVKRANNPTCASLHNDSHLYGEPEPYDTVNWRVEANQLSHITSASPLMDHFVTISRSAAIALASDGISGSRIE